MRSLIPLVLILAAATPGLAREYSPRVISPHNADAYSMKTFAQFPRWRDLKGDARAWEVYRYLADLRTVLFPLGKEVFEGRDALDVYTIVRDPVKLINVYGYGFCGILGPTMAGVCEESGIGRSRTLVLPDYHHVVAETFYDDRWHYLDLDLRAAFRRKDGTLASMADAQRDPSLWRGPQGPLFFPLDPLQATRKSYEKTRVEAHYGYYSGGHTMDFMLRQGETFTRWWTPNGRWNHSDAYAKDPFFKQLFEREPPGPKCKHQGWTIHTHGYGRFTYRPHLAENSSDFADGVYDSDNVRPGAIGLTLAKAGKGHAIFEVRSPYVIVPLVTNIERRERDREASTVSVNSSGATLAISLDHGVSWKELGKAAGDHDLTVHVSGAYGYLLKLTLDGKPEEAVVRALRIDTYVQVAPASLPSLRKGKNRMTYRVGDHHGLRSRVLEIRTNGSERGDLLKYLHDPPKDFDPQRKSSRARGPFVVKVTALPNAKIAWLSAGGSFETHQAAAAKNTRNSIEYAVNEPRDFQPLYRAKVPTDQAHWHYNVDREVKLDKPAKVVYLRYVGDPGVNNLRVYAHCVDDIPPRPCAIVITHGWKVKDALKSKKVMLAAPGSYEVVAEDGDPVDVYLEMAIPTDATP